MTLQLPRQIEVVGCDPSLRNWGLAIGTYDVIDETLNIDHLELIQPVLPEGKQIRKNSLDIESAYQLSKGTLNTISDSDAVFVEVPIGSQSARAMASYGICIGVLGQIKSSGFYIYELSPLEVKLAGAGHKNASKEEMIKWAMDTYPKANWPITKAKQEHLADAIATIHAGIASTAFKQTMSIYKKGVYVNST